MNKRLMQGVFRILSALFSMAISFSSSVALADKDYSEKDIIGTWSRVYDVTSDNAKYKNEETLTFNTDHSYEDKTVKIIGNEKDDSCNEYGNWTLQNNIIDFTVLNVQHSINECGNNPGAQYPMVIMDSSADTLIISFGANCTEIFHRT